MAKKRRRAVVRRVAKRRVAGRMVGTPARRNLFGMVYGYPGYPGGGTSTGGSWR